MIEIQNLTTVIITLILSILLAYVSFTGGASEAYLFPKIITSTMIILSSLSLLFYFFEKILGKPLSQKTQEIFFRIGLFILFSLMFFVTFNDLKDIGLF